ncbi:methyl-accepting chemotaxis protein [bacterium]
MFKRLKFREKIFSIPLAVLFFFFTAIIIITIINNGFTQKRNTLISEGYCPAYMLSRDMEEHLATIKMKLQEAVSTRELDALQEADQARDSFLALTDQGSENPVLKNRIKILETRQRDLVTYHSHARQISEQVINGQIDNKLIDELQIMNERYESLKTQIGQDRINFENEMKSNFLNIYLSNNRSMLIMLGLIIISMGIIGVVNYQMTNSITRNLKSMVKMMKAIAKGEGDLTQRLTIYAYDELGDLANWFNLFVEKLHAIISQVRKNTNQVTDAAAIISDTAMQMAAGAEEHNAQAGEVSVSVEEMTASIMQNSQNAGQTAIIAEDASSKVKQGVETIQATRLGMERIVNASQRMEETVKSLTNRALQIGEITRVIDKIADQTNLLALNAAVEAARAGEQGSGFAVVADEVRKLAERTAEATAEIADTIESIQKDTIDASESMMETKDAVDSGRKATEQAENVLAHILESVNQSVDMIQQIAAASEEQSAGAQEISNSVGEMNSVSKQSSEGAERMSSAARELNAQTEVLNTLVNHFKLNHNS